MKKRGFTLIELIAVIVVLAIIALIATPKIVRVIKDARREATERSAERYLDAVETAVADNKLKENNVIDGVYEVNEEGNLVIEGHEPLIVETSGDKPKEGSKVAIQNGQVISLGTNMTIGKYAVTIDDKGIATAILKDGSTTNSTALCNAIAPTEQLIWDNKTDRMVKILAGVQATETNPYAPGAVYSCELGDGVARTFYVAREDGDNVELIMNENIGVSEWINNKDFIEAGGNQADWDNYYKIGRYGPITANKYLADQSKGWTRLTRAGGIVTIPDYALYEPWGRINLYGNEDGPNSYVTSAVEFPASDYHTIYLVTTYDYSIVVDIGSGGIRPLITISKSDMSL